MCLKQKKYVICDFRSARLRDEKEAASQEKTVFADKGTKWQQSWTESDENFALSYPQNAHPADLVSAMTPPLTPSWSKLFSRDQKLNIVFLGGRRSICSCQCFQGFYLETRHGNVHFSQHFFQDCSLRGRRRMFIKRARGTREGKSSAPLLFSPHARARGFSKFLPSP